MKVNRICEDPIKSALFEANYVGNWFSSAVTCSEIINLANQVINKTDITCTYKSGLIENNTRITKFLYDYAFQNLAYVSIYSKQPYHTKIKMDLQVPLTVFISNLGGLLGICMGLSAITFFECLYHFGHGLYDMTQV